MKWALVTGTSRGLGSAVARALLDRGWTVTGIARGPAPAELAHERYEHRELDLSDLPRTATVVERELAGTMRPGLRRAALVNNAGRVEPVGPVHALDAAELLKTLVLNAATPIWLSGFLLRHFRCPLRIVDVSSGAARSPYPGWSAYCASKAALAMADRVLATEIDEVPALAQRDIAVVTYAPHVVATRMQETVRTAATEDFPRRARFVELHERGDLVAPEGPAREIAELCDADGLPAHSELRFRP